MRYFLCCLPLLVLSATALVSLPETVPAALAQATDARKTEADRLLDRGAKQYRRSQYREALISWQQALALYRQLDDRAREGAVLSNLGSVYFSLGDYAKAIDFYQQYLTIARDIGDRAREGRALSGLGNVYASRGNYVKAIDFHQQHLFIAREIGDSAEEGRAFGNLGIAYKDLGNYIKAIDFFQQHLIIAREIGDRAGEGRALSGLGNAYGNLGNTTRAIDFHQQSLAIARDIGDRTGEGRALGNLGNVYASLGDYAKAINFYQQTLVISQKIGNRASEGITLGNLGVAYDSLGDYTKAMDFHQKSVAIAREIGDRNGEGVALSGLGLAYKNLGNYTKAIDFFQQRLIIAREIGDRAGEGSALGNLGNTYASLGNYAKAIDFYQQCLAIAREIGNRVGEGASLNNLGLAYKNLEQPNQASDFYQQGLALFRQTGYRAGEGIALSNLGVLLAQQNQPELAIVFYKQSVNLREQLRQEQRQQNLSTELQQSYTDTIADSYRELADLLLQQDRVLEAQQVLDLLKVQELEDYLRQVRGTGKQLVELPPEREILAKYNALQKTAIQLGQERSQLRKLASNGRLTPQQEARLAQLVELEEDLNQQFNQFADRPDVIALVEQLDYKVRRQSVDLADLDALRDDLRRLDAVMLYPLILEDRLELVITTPDSPPLRRTVKVSREALNQAIVRFRTSLVNASRTNLPPAQQLYDWLIRPIEADLAQAGAKTIIYAPDGQLRYIPLAALHDGEQWLVQRFRINNITAKSFTDLDRQPASQLRVLAGAFADEQTKYAVQAGGETFEFKGLPFAGKEVALLAQTLPDTSTFLDRDFTLAKLRPVMNSREVLHLATHATFVSGEPEESFILFGDGQHATLTDIRNWTLSNVDLVVLSACETGLGGKRLGNGAEILGLGYQFQQRGVRATVASLWQVNDGSTQALMNAFYGALQQGMTKAEALRQAQIALITGDYSAVGGQRASLAAVPKDGAAASPSGLAHPYYWAPFILIGNGL